MKNTGGATHPMQLYRLSLESEVSITLLCQLCSTHYTQAVARGGSVGSDEPP